MPGHVPILGARTLRQMQDNLGCLEFSLTPEQMERLSAAASRYNPRGGEQGGIP